MNDQTPRRRLFQDLPDPGAEPPAPRLGEQLLGVFTGPTALFRRMARTPRWGQALLVCMCATLVMVLIWAGRVDPDALLRPILERDPRLAPELANRAIEIQGRMLGLLGALGVLAGLPAVNLVLALALWLIGRAAPGPAGSPGFRQALCAATLSGLASLPKALMISCLCLARPVYGLRPDELSPLSLGAWYSSGHARLDALLTGFDLFTVGGLVLLFLAARHVLGLGTGPALGCAAAGALLSAALLANSAL
jgi:hypothetical protein